MRANAHFACLFQKFIVPLQPQSHYAFQKRETL